MIRKVVELCCTVHYTALGNLQPNKLTTAGETQWQQTWDRARILATVLCKMSMHLRHSMASSADCMPLAASLKSQRSTVGPDSQRLPIKWSTMILVCCTDVSQMEVASCMSNSSPCKLATCCHCIDGYRIAVIAFIVTEGLLEGGYSDADMLGTYAADVLHA